MYKLITNSVLLSTAELIKEFHQPEKFLAYCEQCDNYNKRWSCPPVQFDPTEYLQKYQEFLFLGFKIVYTPEFLEQLKDQEQANYYSGRLLKKLRKFIAGICIDLEAFSTGSRSFGAGSCLWCCKCSRQYPEPAPCKKPDKMRYSLDTFGLDLTRLSTELLNTPILWTGDPLPEYHHLIFALGLKAGHSEKIIEALGEIPFPKYTMEDLEVKHKKPVCKE